MAVLMSLPPELGLGYPCRGLYTVGWWDVGWLNSKGVTGTWCSWPLFSVGPGGHVTSHVSESVWGTTGHGHNMSVARFPVGFGDHVTSHVSDRGARGLAGVALLLWRGAMVLKKEVSSTSATHFSG